MRQRIVGAIALAGEAGDAAVARAAARVLTSRQFPSSSPVRADRDPEPMEG